MTALHDPRRRLTRRALLCKAGCAAAAALFPGCAAACFADEPRVANLMRGRISDEQEIAIGRRFAEEFEAESPVLANPLIDQHLNAMVRELAAKSQRPRMPYHVKVINMPAINAASLPGGSIYVYRGMLGILSTENELAAVLAHEIGHIAGRHTINQLMLTFQAQALLKPLLENLNRQNGAVEKILEQLGGAVALIARLSYSRQDEAQADLLGFYDMLRAGWDPRGFLAMFDAMEEQETTSQSASQPALLAHPPTEDRVAAIERELKLVTIPEDARTDSLDFRACKAALQLLTSHPAQPPG